MKSNYISKMPLTVTENSGLISYHSAQEESRTLAKSSRPINLQRRLNKVNSVFVKERKYTYIKHLQERVLSQ